jgi:hypothetical protein
MSLHGPIYPVASSQIRTKEIRRLSVHGNEPEVEERGKLPLARSDQAGTANEDRRQGVDVDIPLSFSRVTRRRLMLVAWLA